MVRRATVRYLGLAAVGPCLLILLACGGSPEWLNEKGVPDLRSGRINNLPVSWFYRTSFGTEGPLQLRTVCNGSNDTGLLVSNGLKTSFNDDSPLAGGNNLGSYVQFEAFGTFRAYTIFVFSMRRATSKCTLQRSTDEGSSWTDMRTDEFGGALVEVGPFRNGDFLEVQTAGSGDDVGRYNDSDTVMILFNPDKPALWFKESDNLGPADWDPRITVTDTAWTGQSNLALVGKVSRGTHGPSGVEVKVDLIHGPLGSDQRSATFPVSGGTGNTMALDVGRYYAWVYAATDNPVGSGEINPASAMFDGACDSPFVRGLVPTCTYDRGTLNGLAFRVRAERKDEETGRWVNATPVRSISRASLGTAAGEGWNLFLVELKVNTPGNYHLVTTDEAADVRFHGKWHVERNPDASEHTVATFNTLYDLSPYCISRFLAADSCFRDEHRNKTKNASNLIATRGSIFPSLLKIEERADQASWQWNADIIGLQELHKQGSDGFELARVFAGEAFSRAGKYFNIVRGRDEDFATGTSGVGPLFLAGSVTPRGGIYFSNSAKSAAGCRGRQPLDYAECQLEAFGGLTKATNFAIPGRATARRWGSSADRPIAVFNVHLEHRAGDTDDRRAEINSLIRTMDALLQADPGAFNSDAANPDRKHPKFYQNRMIVLGDFNMMAHSYGEHYWLLQTLREHYGYAVDVSMAVNFSGQHDTFGMHDESGALDGSLKPIDYQSYQAWRGAPNHTLSSKYPWWAATWRGATGRVTEKGDRHDAIFLIGKGWAYDDPVRDYMVMSDRQYESPLNPVGGGVEMWIGGNSVTDGSNNYAPNHDLGFGTDAGKPALHSDHLPVGAKLRVFAR